MHIRLIMVGLVLISVFELAQAQDPSTPADGSFAALVAAADPGKGAISAKKCVACHTFEQGAANRIGPNLWNVIGRAIASVPGYTYSEALTAFSERGSKLWTIDELDGYLLNPREHVPGTKMAFAGLKSDEERANVIAYLGTLADRTN